MSFFQSIKSYQPRTPTGAWTKVLAPMQPQLQHPRRGWRASPEPTAGPQLEQCLCVHPIQASCHMLHSKLHRLLSGHSFPFLAVRRGRHGPRSSFYSYFENSSSNLSFDQRRQYARFMGGRIGKHHSFSKKCKRWLNQAALLRQGCQPQLPASHEVEWMLVLEAGCHKVSEHTATSLWWGTVSSIGWIEWGWHIQAPQLDHRVSEVGQEWEDLWWWE